MKDERITSFTGVPFSFEILQKLRFFRMDLPDLEVITQGGGKLNSELFDQFANMRKVRERNLFLHMVRRRGQHVWHSLN